MRNPVQPMDRKMMREMNQNMLLNLIRHHAPVSRTQLKHLSGLSLGTIVGITSALIEQQLVIEKGVAESTGGRKAGLLEISPDGGYVIGLELREHKVVGALLNLHGNVIYTEIWPAQMRNNAAQAIDIIVAGIETFISHLPVPREKILGLGCGISGPVNSQTGINVDSWILNWHNVELSRPLSARLRIPVFVDNAVNCLASYEKLYGNGKKYHNFLLITLGRGLGMAIVIHDDLFRGALGLGAEFGHIPFDATGRQCECGNQGCLEAYVSDHGVLRTYHELSLLPITIDADQIGTDDINDLISRMHNGDSMAHKTFVQTGTRLGLGLATLVNLFNPECIIVSGGEWQIVAPLQEAMQEAMKHHIFSQLGNKLEIVVENTPPTLNWARGAGCLVLRDFFLSPAQI